MSIFIGKDYNNLPLVHMTRGFTDLSVLKGGPTSNTILHSDINYTGFSVFDPAPSEYLYTEGSDGKYRAEFTFSQSPTMTRLKQYLFGGSTGHRRSFIAFVNNTIQMNRAVEIDESFGGFLSAGSFIYASNGQLQWEWKSNTTWLGITSKVPISSIYFVAFDVDIMGVDNMDTFRFYRKDIELDASSFRIGGVELSAVPFICFGELMNNEDYSGRITGGTSVQFINSVVESGSYNITLSNGRGVIAKGSKAIIDTQRELAVSRVHETQVCSRSVTNFSGGSAVSLGSLNRDGVYIFTALFDTRYGIETTGSTLGIIGAAEPVNVMIPLQGMEVRVNKNTRQVTAHNLGESGTYKSGTNTLKLTATRLL